MFLGKRAIGAPRDSAGVMATACVEEEMRRNTGSPIRWWVKAINWTPVRDSGHLMLELSLNMGLVGNPKKGGVGIAATFKRGEDPSSGFDKQTVTRISATVRY